jgi:hypothetical protein
MTGSFANLRSPSAVACLERWRDKLPEATVILSKEIKNREFSGDVILIADEIENVVVKGHMLAFSSSYINVEVRSQSYAVLMVRKNLRILNSEIIANGAKVSIRFLFATPHHVIIADGRRMTINQYMDYWIRMVKADGKDAEYRKLSM